jgi:hypothetical protein
MINITNFKQDKDGNLITSDSSEDNAVYKRDFRNATLSIQDIEIVKWHSLYSYDPISDEEMPLEYENDSGIRIEGRVVRDVLSDDRFYYLNEDENNKGSYYVEELGEIRIIIGAPKEKKHLYGYFNRNIRIITETSDVPYFYLSFTKKQFESLMDDLENDNNLSLSINIFFYTYITDADLDTQIYTDYIPEDFLIKQFEACAVSTISTTSKKGAHQNQPNSLAIGGNSNNQLMPLLKSLLLMLLIITALIAYKF